MHRIVPPGLMVVSGVSLYAGAAIAVGLFDAFPPALVAWMRISAAAVILVALYRPSPRAFVGRAGMAALVYGLMTMFMNMTFYVAIDQIPLGTAVAVEFLGPVAVAALGSRSARDWAALALAAAGVLVISGATWSDNGTGILWALGAGILWAGYILVGSRIAADAGASRSSMAAGFAWAAVLAAPVMVAIWPDGAPAHAIGLAKFSLLWLGLGIFSAALPYSLDQVVMRLAGASHFALLQAILPLVAALVGAVLLGQWLSVPELVGIAAIVAAVALRAPAAG